MYTLTIENQTKPFAIIKDPWPHSVEQAIKRNGSYEYVYLTDDLNKTDFPLEGESLKGVVYCAPNVKGTVTINRLLTIY